MKNETIAEIKIKQLVEIDDGTLVMLRGKVLSLSPIRAVSTGIVQDVTIADETNLSAWDKKNIDMLEPGKLYKFHNVYVRSYKDDKCLSLSQKTKYKVVEEKEMEVFEVSAENEVVETIENPMIVGTQNFQIHYTCNTT